jgi:hypothetical protein
MRPRITLNSIGWVYLWHFSRPLGNLANPRAQAHHYIGYCDDPDGDALELERRAAEHLAGRGAKITRAAIAQGIEITLVTAWRAPLAFEKRLKARKDAPRLCPICCRKHGRKVKQVVVAEQLELPFDCLDTAPIEPWPADFDFPTAPSLRPDWIEISTLRRWRSLGPAALAENWDDGLL